MRNLDKLDLKEHIASTEKKQRYVNHLFETIASRYDFFTVFMSFGMDRGWKRTLAGLPEMKADALILDLACGTGDITFEVARRANSWGVIGLDINDAMLEIAERKRRNRGVRNVCFHRGDIMRMPFAGATFDYITSGYALRNVPEITGALFEIRRVLKPGGRFFALDFGHPANGISRWLYINYLILAGSAAGALMHGDPDTYRYIGETLKLYPGQRKVKELMERSGFVDTGFREFGGGIMAINYGARPG
ncbi:MAG TPA: ubiquinone/menaquinone biosynthesis methyltransferase [Blastocatellia bacterium]|nr:ubiquinone/menaquinone biosynthesis methyltransferase [Blastocatellia bacterium]